MNCDNMTEKCPDCEMDIEETDIECQNSGKQLKTKRLTKEMVEDILKNESISTGFDPKLKTSTQFLDFWMALNRELKDVITIQNWTVDKAYYGEDFKAKFNQLSNKVEIYLPSKKKALYASRDDFKIVYNKWNDYIEGDISRSAFIKSHKTKYTISIIHHIIQ